MKRFHAAFALLAIFCQGLPATEINLLEEDWSVATEKAQESGKYLFIAFLGDGWSMGSKRFQEAVLDTPEFKQFAASHLVYCPVLARSMPKLGKKQTARLQSLVIHLDIKSYPTFILIAPDRTEVLRHGYIKETAKEYIALLEALLPVRADP
ncbi:hypothetical protein G0Q06_06215 [Puniceicoccales bacterium CK1056]|uniref:Thioredoxin domain-containing protein n=1 Tax=Oceanipulchritudo coccoides TaxID=2706888 RepID=A0A6B2M2K6_9BACT|nr:hypothetical protein [Oceanipulchritudo coccoides]